MTRGIIAALILILCVSVAVTSLIFIENSCRDMISIIDNTIEAAKKEDDENIAKGLLQAISYLERSRPYFNFIIGQGETTELRASMNKAVFFANTRDYSSLTLHLLECKTELNRIITANEPIFLTHN